MTKVLITGATGFVGRHVLDALKRDKIDTKAVIRSQCNSLNSEKSGNLNIVYTDNIFLESVEWWKNVCTDVDIVIHIAWYAEPGKYLDSEENIDCLSGTINLAKGAASAGVKKFVGIGSCFEYDLTGGLISEKTPLKPLTLYAATKVSAYLTLSEYFKNTSIDFSWCRLFYLYGEGENDKRLVPYIRKKLSADEYVEMTNGTQIRDYLDVKIAAKMIVNVAFGKKIGGINICSGVPITIRSFAESIADEFGKRHLLKFGAREDNITDPPFVVGERIDL